MSRLSHIEDVEQRARQEQEPQEPQQPQEPVAREPEQVADQQPASPAAAPQKGNSVDLTAAEEEDFHGLSESRPMGAGHKFLIILACVVLAGAILYIINSWIHFV